jgi:two-component system NtrC family response regulator
VECEAIKLALERCGGNVSQAARFLRVTRQTVIYRMKKYGLSGDTSDEE